MPKTIVFTLMALAALGAWQAFAAPGGQLENALAGVTQSDGVCGGDNHGGAVCQVAHDAKELAPGERGQVVSEAARDRSTLPESAQNAPGQNATEGVVAQQSDGVCGGEGNHGAAVCLAAHTAQDLPPGPGRGLAVSEVARDRSTLPEPAQNAPGQLNQQTTGPTTAGATGNGGPPAHANAKANR